MKTINTLIFYMSCFVASNSYAGYDEDVAAINKSMPKQVQQFNKRQIACNHWSGEEPYDKARAMEIAAAVKKLRCDALDKDEKFLLKKYKTKPNIINSINKAKAYI